MKIEISGVSKHYGSVRALDGVWMDLRPGEIVAVLGPNGAGKTTLFRCLMGLSVPDKGEVLFNGEPFSRDRLDLRREMLFLPDFPFVFGNMTVIRHIGMMLQVYQKDVPGVEEEVIRLLKEFDLVPLAQVPLGFLSRGQLYKAALVSAFAIQPQLWILDEPFASGMDPHGINTFKVETRKAAARGQTIIYSTQILDVAENFSDRACVIHQGEIRAFDSVANLKTQQQSEGSVLEAIFNQLKEKQDS